MNHRDGVACPCCGRNTLTSTGANEICAVCGWEDDPSQSADPRLTGGANVLNLEDARAAFQSGGQLPCVPRRWEWRASWAQYAGVWLNELFVLALAAGAVAGCVYHFQVDRSVFSVIGAVLAAGFGSWCIWTVPRTARAAPIVVRASARRLTVRYPRRCVSVRWDQLDRVFMVVSTLDSRVRKLQVHPPSPSPPMCFVRSYMGGGVYELAELVRHRIAADRMTIIPRKMAGVHPAADRASRGTPVPTVFGVPPAWVATAGMAAFAVAAIVRNAAADGDMLPLPAGIRGALEWPVGAVFVFALAYVAVALVQRKPGSAACGGLGAAASGAGSWLLL